MLAKAQRRGCSGKYRVPGFLLLPLHKQRLTSPRGRLAKKFGTILEIYVPLELLQNTSTQIQQLALFLSSTSL